MRTLFIVIISDDAKALVECLFTTSQAREALLAISALQRVAPTVHVHLWADMRCILRVRDGQWRVETALREAA